MADQPTKDRLAWTAGMMKGLIFKTREQRKKEVAEAEAARLREIQK